MAQLDTTAGQYLRHRVVTLNGGKDLFFLFLFLLFSYIEETIVKSGVISGRNDEDRLPIWIPTVQEQIIIYIIY